MKIQRINLLPEHLKDETKLNKDHGILLGFASVFVLLIGLAVVQFVQLSSLNNKVNSVKAKSGQIQGQISTLQIATAHQEVARAREQAVLQVLKQRVVWSKVLREISLVTPDSIWLNAFRVDDTSKGDTIVVTGESPTPLLITKYFRVLENSLFFRKVQLVYTEKLASYSPDLYRFEFELTIDSKSMEVAHED